MPPGPVVVSGAASGIGRATAERLVAAGRPVALLDLDGGALARVAARLDGPVPLVAVRLDVTDADAVETAVAGVVDDLGAPSGVVTAAGIFDSADLAPVAGLDLGAFDRVLDVNLRGTVHVLRSVLPRLVDGGAVVTVASTAGLRGHGLGAGYTASKGAVVALTRLVAVQEGRRGVRANCVCPGATAGEGMGRGFADPGTAARAARGVPLGRVGTAEEVAGTIVALLGEATDYVTGQVIAVDGGVTAR